MKLKFSKMLIVAYSLGFFFNSSAYSEDDPHWTMLTNCKSRDGVLSVSIAKRFDRTEYEMTVRQGEYMSELLKSGGGFTKSSDQTAVYHYIGNSVLVGDIESGLLLVRPDGTGEFFYHSADPAWSNIKSIATTDLSCKRF